MEKETEDERREAAIAASASLGPTFKPKSGLTESQLAKFQELHKRRLQIKARSKSHQRDKGSGDVKGKPQNKCTGARDCVEPIKPLASQSKTGNSSSFEEAGKSASNKRQKLFWGLDAKERWERKANM